MAVDGKQIRPATVANNRLATASNTASPNSVVLSKPNAKIDISYIPVDELDLSGSTAFVEDAFTTLQTTSDGDPISATGLSSTPGPSASVLVYLNGILIQQISYGNKTGSLYFSSTDGTTAAARDALATGTRFYWNASIAGFQLQAGWRVKIIYTM